MATTPKKPTTRKATKKTTGKKKVVKKKSAKKKASRSRSTTGKRVWRFAKLKNKSGKDIYPRLGKGGVLDKAAATRLKVKQHQNSWLEVEAVTQKEATALVKKGSGKRVAQPNGGKGK